MSAEQSSGGQTEYIQHHLHFLQWRFGSGEFAVLNIDTLFFTSILMLLFLVGFLLWIAVAVLVVVRCVLSLINAQKHEPMPNPDTWLA